MSNQAIFYLMGIAGGGFVAIIIAYLIIRKALDKGDKTTKRGNIKQELFSRCNIPKVI